MEETTSMKSLLANAALPLRLNAFANLKSAERTGCLAAGQREAHGGQSTDQSIC